MRISTMMVYNNLVKNLAKGAERTQEIQEVITSGKKINRLSDDPIGVSKVVNYQSHLNKLGQYRENITYGNSWLSMSDSVLLDMQNLVTEAKTIAIAQATETATPETRAQAAVAVRNLYEQLIAFANTKLGDTYIFGGSQTNIAPFNSDGTYNGNADDILIEIMEGIKSKINVAGSEFLITDLNPVLSFDPINPETAGRTSSTGLVARNSNTIVGGPAPTATSVENVSNYRVTFVLNNGMSQEITYTTDGDATQEELGMGIADTVNSHDVLNQHIRATYDPATGAITFEAKVAGEEGNEFTIDADNTTAFEVAVLTTEFTGGSTEINSGFVFDASNAEIVFSENGGLDITADLITDGGAVPGVVYSGDQVAVFIERAMEDRSLYDPNGNGYSYTVSYDESTNRFSIANDAGNPGSLNLRWGAAGTTAEQTLGFIGDSGPLAPDASDTSDTEVEFNVIAGENNEFSIAIDGIDSGTITITAGAYNTTTLLAEMQGQIGGSATVSFDATSGQFVIESATTGIGSSVSLTRGTNDFLRTVGLDRDFAVAGTGPTRLADLNGGIGVATGTIRIYDRAGNITDVAVDATETIEDVINNISAVPNITATLNDRNGITITDSTGFPIQNLVIEDRTSTTARDLGIVGNKPGPIYGTDLNPAVSDFTRIDALNGGTGLSLGTIRVVNGQQNEIIDLSRAESIRDVINALNDLGIDDITASINSSGTAIDVISDSSDFAVVVNDMGEGTTASDLGIQGAADVFKTLAVLEEALEKNDQTALLNMLDQFDLVLETLVQKGSEVGVRTNKLEAMNNRINVSEVEISGLKSEIEDADMIEYLTKFTLQQTALEAIMTTAGQSIQLSLLNFLR